MMYGGNEGLLTNEFQQIDNVKLWKVTNMKWYDGFHAI